MHACMIYAPPSHRSSCYPLIFCTNLQYSHRYPLHTHTSYFLLDEHILRPRKISFRQDALILSPFYVSKHSAVSQRYGKTRPVAEPDMECGCGMFLVRHHVTLINERPQRQRAARFDCQPQRPGTITPLLARSVLPTLTRMQHLVAPS